MIKLSAVTVSGESEAGPFEGTFLFRTGLNIISARNAYGKSLFCKAFAWCLGLEPMYGLQDNDTSFFSPAVRDVIDLDGQVDIPVLSSQASIVIERDDGAMVRIQRSIHGNSKDEVVVEEINDNGLVTKKSRMLARKKTLVDQTGGLQHFLFSWMGLPVVQVMTNHGRESPVYLENIAPLFLIDQNEGWADLQSLQIFRYRQQEIKQVAVEYLIGAIDSIRQRFQAQQIISKESKLKAEAESIASRVETLYEKRGCPVKWSSFGTSRKIAARWSQSTLDQVAKKQYDLDLAVEYQHLDQQAEFLRKRLLHDDLDPVDTSAGSEASQNVIELKSKRHETRDELRTARTQLAEQRQLIKGIESRIQSSRDILRFKELGIGRFEVVECPTCHRDLDPDTFHLTVQSKESVAAHIESLRRDRSLVRSNIGELEREEGRIASLLDKTQDRLKDAQRTLATVNSAVGTVREQIGKAATELASVERRMDRNRDFHEEVAGLQKEIDDWIKRVELEDTTEQDDSHLVNRLDVFIHHFRQNLCSLGHSAVTESNKIDVRVDDQYTPYIGSRRLRSTGSASDHSRLIAAYVIGLAEAGINIGAPHPGLVILDEPLQQNPDKEHRGKLVQFLQGLDDVLQNYQLIVLTHLFTDEIQEVEKRGVPVNVLEGEHFLEPRESPGEDTP